MYFCNCLMHIGQWPFGFAKKKRVGLMELEEVNIGPASPFSFLNPFVQRGFMYCKANDKNDSGLADPVCYRVRYSSYLDEKSNHFEKSTNHEISSKSPNSQEISELKDLENNLNPTDQKNKDSKKSKAKR